MANPTQQSEELKKLQQEYLLTVLEKIEEVDFAILDLENDLSPKNNLNKIKSQIHSIKGSAGSYDFDFASTICHHFEDFLSTISENVKLRDETNILLKYNDLLKEFFTLTYEQPSFPLGEFKQRLEAITPGVIDESLFTGYKVLLLEPVNTITMCITERLNEIGIEVSGCQDGLEALGRLLRENFDCFITSENTKFIKGHVICSVLKQIKETNMIHSIIITSSKSLKISGPDLPDKVLQKGPKLLDELKKYFLEIIKKNNAATKKLFHKPKTKKLSKILYVDDDLDIHRLVRLGFKLFPDIEICYCESGKEALLKIEDFKPDIILLDYMMPEMNGEKVLQELRAKPALANYPVVFLTGKSSKKEIKSLIMLGALGVITKPFKINTLHQKVFSLWADHTCPK